MRRAADARWSSWRRRVVLQCFTMQRREEGRDPCVMQTHKTRHASRISRIHDSCLVRFTSGPCASCACSSAASDPARALVGRDGPRVRTRREAGACRTAHPVPASDLDPDPGGSAAHCPSRAADVDQGGPDIGLALVADTHSAALADARVVKEAAFASMRLSRSTPCRRPQSSRLTASAHSPDTGSSPDDT